ncbi:MAG: hypothetical protein ABIC95_02470 [archaeon]
MIDIRPDLILLLRKNAQYNRETSLDKDREIYLGPRNEVNMALMGTGVISRWDDKRPILGAYGLGPCTTLCAYDPEQRLGFTMSVPTFGPAESLLDLLVEETVKRSEKGFNPEFHLVGGYDKSSQPMQKRITDYLDYQYKGKNDLKTDDTLGLIDPTGLGRSFLLDTRDGKIYAWDQIRTPDSVPRHKVTGFNPF